VGGATAGQTLEWLRDLKVAEGLMSQILLHGTTGDAVLDQNIKSAYEKIYQKLAVRKLYSFCRYRPSTLLRSMLRFRYNKFDRCKLFLQTLKIARIFTAGASALSFQNFANERSGLANHVTQIFTTTSKVKCSSTPS